ncbi:hypothetical protein [Methanobacterium formicicum]|jgi:hypothetical protein|uniref:Uncharacterized protein n=1 Tax=Methanobacterium formicicum TaxID=2162 RepID=A0A089ZVI1_METFO|nr:hypothetical protein [Methanobacterium formicicum]AIS32474.1 hypothetical protein BRM9_1662 [Methanobacterium formicicum]
MAEEETKPEETITEGLENNKRNAVLQEISLWVLIFIVYLGDAISRDQSITPLGLVLILAAVARLYIKVKFPQFQLN